MTAPFDKRFGSKRNASNFLVGAAVGTGLAARSASRGGADFLLAVSAGKMRSMGAASIASLLPLFDSNVQVFEFAEKEILGGVAVPVFFGASAFNPRENLRSLVDRIAVAGFAGVVNFPSSIFLSGGFRERVEMAGVGFSRELELFRLAKERGLRTLGYVCNRAEAQQMASAGADIINLNLGWNSGGSSGAKSTTTLEEAGEFARLIIRGIRKIAPKCICMIEGGPIVEPDDMYIVTQGAQADGYIGGSTIDRIPLEQSIEHVTTAFKAVNILRLRVEELERQDTILQKTFGVVGNSDSMIRVQHQIGKVSRNRLPAAVVGPNGSGKELVARALHLAAGQRPADFYVISSDECYEARLFGAVQTTDSSGTQTKIGRLEVRPGSTVFFEEVARLPVVVRQKVLDMIERKGFQRLGDNTVRPFDARVIFGSQFEIADLVETRRVDSRFERTVRDQVIRLVPLVDRLDDIPLLVYHFLKEARTAGKTKATGLDGVAFRALLAHSWPGNVRELRSVIEHAAASSGARSIVGVDDLPSLSGEVQAEAIKDERAWILDGLKRSRFRKSQTAQLLGISRKTLYNKMKQHGLPVASRGDSEH